MRKKISILFVVIMILSVIACFVGCDGEQGPQGNKGDKGEDGVGIQSIEINEQGNWVITLTDGTELPPIELPQADKNYEDTQAVQDARIAYLQYLIENGGKEELPEIFLFTAKAGRVIAVKKGAVLGFYSHTDDALKSLLDDPATKDQDESLRYEIRDTDINGLQICVERSVYCVSLDGNTLTIVEKGGDTVVAKLPETNVVFSKKDLKAGVNVPESVQMRPDSMGMNVTFKVADVRVDLSVSATDVPEGYYLFHYRYPIKADGTTAHNYGWLPVNNGDRIYNSQNMQDIGYVDYAASFCFSSDATELIPVNPPDTNWSIVLHEYGKTAFEYTYKIVDVNGTGDYTSVADAVAQEPENTVLVILPGIYEGTVRAFRKSIIMVGVDKEKCILKSYDGQRSNPVLEASCGYVANLTMHSEYVEGVSKEIGASGSGAYAVHIEHEYGVGKRMEIRSCNLISDFFPALGVGLRKDFTLIVEDCELISNQVVGRGDYTAQGSLGALYFHDSVGAAGNSYIKVQNCTITAQLKNAICPFTLYGNSSYPNAINNKVYCTFINNKITGEIWDRNGNAFEKNFILTEDSHGNTLERLNCKKEF